ncbi:hypothetical protein ACVDHI_00395 [Aeromonas sp. 25-248]|uniref:hypothetical protein n=1 Tax=Aeromonas caviae TaxID=648 RepID=UPI0029DC5BB3|nr:hypothetical protein [Aeromonas caviae]MDX7855662.1 hypothetical protein [Aeromonas caviae]
MAFPVKWYSNAMQGAPSLGDTSAGALAALLKAVLVTGFGTLTINALVWDATEGAAKATISGGHAYLQDSVVEVSGASPAAYNGEHRVKKVSSTEVWFELDGGNPGSAGSGTMSMKVAPLGWTQTHESGDGMVAIYRPTNVSESGNVSLRVDNTAFSGWAGTTYKGYLAKVAMVEDVVDINTYTLIYEHRWPATKAYSTGNWDLIGDPQLFYFLPAYGILNRQALYAFGYINSIRPGDRYHAILIHYASTSANADTRSWEYNISSNGNYYNEGLAFDATTFRVIARSYSQLFGTSGFWLKGLFPRFGTGMNTPNGPDNGFYMSGDPCMVMETGNHLRGYLPGLICPFATVTDWHRKNFAALPALNGKLARFLLATYTANGTIAPTMAGFDLTGPWR